MIVTANRIRSQNAQASVTGGYFLAQNRASAALMR